MQGPDENGDGETAGPDPLALRTDIGKGHMQSTRRSFRGLLLVLVVLGAGLAPEASSASGPTTWTISAAASATGTFRLTRSLHLDIQASINDIGFGDFSIDDVVSMSGRYGGVVIRDSHDEVRVGVLRYAELGTIVLWGQFNDANDQILEPGRYSVTVLGNRATSVKLRVQGAAPAPVFASAPALVVVHEISDAGSLQGQVPVAAQTLPLSVTARSTYVALGVFQGPLSGVDYKVICLKKPVPAPVCTPADRAATVVGLNVGSSRESAAGLIGIQNQTIPGTYQVIWNVAPAGLSARHALLTLTAD